MTLLSNLCLVYNYQSLYYSSEFIIIRIEGIKKNNFKVKEKKGKGWQQLKDQGKYFLFSCLLYQP